MYLAEAHHNISNAGIKVAEVLNVHSERRDVVGSHLVGPGHIVGTVILGGRGVWRAEFLQEGGKALLDSEALLRDNICCQHFQLSVCIVFSVLKALAEVSEAGLQGREHHYPASI